MQHALKHVERPGGSYKALDGKKRGQHTLGQLWTSQLSPQATEDLKATNAVLPGLRAQYEAAKPHEQTQLLQLWTPNCWQTRQSTFHGPLYALQHATLLSMSGDTQAV